MAEKALGKNRSSDLMDRDTELKQALENLTSENSQLKRLVVSLSETVLRNVTAKL